MASATLEKRPKKRPMDPLADVGNLAELLDRLDGSEIDTLVIVLSSDEKKSTALKVIDSGSYDYFTKPVDMDVLRHLLERAVEKLHIQRENRILRDEISRKNTLGDFIGRGLTFGKKPSPSRLV